MENHRIIWLIHHYFPDIAHISTDAGLLNVLSAIFETHHSSTIGTDITEEVKKKFPNIQYIKFFVDGNNLTSIYPSIQCVRMIPPSDLEKIPGEHNIESSIYSLSGKLISDGLLIRKSIDNKENRYLIVPEIPDGMICLNGKTFRCFRERGYIMTKEDDLESNPYIIPTTRKA